MLSDPLFVVAAIACLITVGVLLVGIGSFGVGGEFNQRNANKLMRLRIAAQFVAVVLIVIFIAVRNGG